MRVFYFMKKEKLDLQVGLTYHWLTILKNVGAVGEKDTGIYYLCRCVCGKEINAKGSDLVRGAKKSCGCLRLFMGVPHENHKGYKSRLYKIWGCMKSRCSCQNKSDPNYWNYYLRGIKVCEEWVRSFKSFREWAIQNGYSEKLTLDRKDNDGNYTPSNCRWATRKVQSNNTRRNVMIDYNGKVQSISDWANEFGINQSTLYHRVTRYGIPFDEAISFFIKRKVRLDTRMATVGGVTKTIREWAQQFGIDRSVIVSRLNKGWDDERAITTPKRE